LDAAPGLDVGERWLFVEQQNQASSLAQVEANGAAARELPGLLQEVGREAGTEGRRGTRHGSHPQENGNGRLIDSP
jgi:hypothetical protein